MKNKQNKQNNKNRDLIPYLLSFLISQKLSSTHFVGAKHAQALFFPNSICQMLLIIFAIVFLQIFSIFFGIYDDRLYFTILNMRVMIHDTQLW